MGRDQEPSRKGKGVGFESKREKKKTSGGEDVYFYKDVVTLSLGRMESYFFWNRPLFKGVSLCRERESFISRRGTYADDLPRPGKRKPAYIEKR